MLLTLFSKFFSPFPHGTCALSVCHLYLVLCEIYHTLKAAFPSNPTRRKHPVRGGTDGQTGLSPSLAVAFQLTSPYTSSGSVSKYHNFLIYKTKNSRHELNPVHSQLLRVSGLDFFPPLKYMLKLSGSSYPPQV